MDEKRKRRLAWRLAIICALPLGGAVVALRLGYLQVGGFSLLVFYGAVLSAWTIYSNLTGAKLADVFAFLKGRSILTGRQTRNAEGIPGVGDSGTGTGGG